jgi:hypothetical protein
MHHHIRAELLFDVRLLYFDCNFSSVFESGFVDLGQRGGCDRLFIEILENLIDRLPHIFLKYFFDFLERGSFGLIL